MATINAAKALGLDRSVGKVQTGYAANLLLIDRALVEKHKNPYTALVKAEQENVNLVVVAGEPLYGDVVPMQSVQAAFGDATPVELLPVNASSCGFQKALRLPGSTAVDAEAAKAGANYRTAAGLESDLKARLAAYKQQVQGKEPSKVKHLVGLDPIFKCEDAAYVEEFNRYVEVSLDRNVRSREALRSQYKLNNQWTPMKDAKVGEEPAAD